MELNEEFVANDSMKKFFINLLELKEFVKNVENETGNKKIAEIYQKLDLIIKEKV